MKKILGILLALLLVVSILPAGAMAAGVVLSPQNLRVDGAPIACEKYNIDGSNYFKLRDIASLLNGTGSQFSVGWDGAKGVISIVTGEPYVPNGSELDLSGGDKSASAAPSTQTIMINGAERSDLKAYNIGGNNFFRLRDLGDALGFQVNYDAPSNSAIIVSRELSWPTPWLIQEEIYNTNGAAISHRVVTFDADGRMLTSLYEGPDYRDMSTFVYDELGRTLRDVNDTESWSDEDSIAYHSTTDYTYNIWGLLEKTVYQATGDIVVVTTYTYDENGRQTEYSVQNNAGTSTYRDYYDEQGRLIRTESESEGELQWYTLFTRDEDGNILSQRGYSGDGTLSYAEEFVYENGWEVRSTYTSGSSDYRSVTTTLRDAQGRVLHTESESNYGNSSSDYEYDEEGRVLRYESTDFYGTYVTEYVYDALGNVLRERHTYPDGGVAATLYTYDGEGRQISRFSEDDGVETREEITYDEAAGKMTTLIMTVYPPVEALQLDCWEQELGVGEDFWLYYYFEPENALYEKVTWSSSEPTVAEVDEYGCVTAVSPGMAVVTATSESGFIASCLITVVSHSVAKG